MITSAPVATEHRPAVELPVVLRVDGLDVDIRTPAGTVRAVSDAGFEVRAGRTRALLGESGCGKSMTAKAVVGLLDPVFSGQDGDRARSVYQTIIHDSLPHRAI